MFRKRRIFNIEFIFESNSTKFYNHFMIINHEIWKTKQYFDFIVFCKTKKFQFRHLIRSTNLNKKYAYSTKMRVSIQIDDLTLISIACFQQNSSKSHENCDFFVFSLIIRKITIALRRFSISNVETFILFQRRSISQRIQIFIIFIIANSIILTINSAACSSIEKKISKTSLHIECKSN